MKELYLYILLIISCTTVAQEIQIKNRLTGEPIPYASVYFTTKGVTTGGIACNDAGVANVPTQEYDALKISCVGYEEARVTKDAVSKGVVYLKPLQKELEELIVTNTTATLGYKGKKGRYLGITKDVEKVVFFKNPYKEASRIKKFSVKIKKAPVKMIVRLVMYKVTDTINHYTPGETLLREDILFTIEQNKTGLIEIDLRAYNLFLPPEGAYVGMEALDCFDKNGNCSQGMSHLTQFETVQTYDETYLINYKFTDRGWRNINKEWVKITTELYENPKNRRSKKYFVIPQFSLEVYAN